MKLYTFDSAPNPARLKMFIDYKGIEIDTVQIDMGKAAQLEADYTEIVPEATLPALVLDDGSRLTEVIAIAHYLEGLHPDRPLLGTNNEEKAMILNWNHRLFNTVFMACAEIFRNSHPAYASRGLPGPADMPQIPALAERGRARLDLALKTLEHELGGRPFVAGDTFSFADIDLLAAVVFAKWGAKVDLSEEYPNLLAWRARTEAALQAESS
jgi:glutathione S-transferase